MSDSPESANEKKLEEMNSGVAIEGEAGVLRDVATDDDELLNAIINKYVKSPSR